MEGNMIYVLFLIILGLQVYIIYKISKKNVTVHKVIEKKELTEEEKVKQKRMREHFENLMGYGYEQALKKKE